MRKLRWLVVVAAILAVAMPAMAAKKTRTTVVVTKGWPLTRPLRTVVVRPVRTPIVVTTSAYLAPVVFASAAVTLPPPNQLIWNGTETLMVDDDWTEFTLNAGMAGQHLYMNVQGTTQLDFAEVVYADGQAQVVDFGDAMVQPGVYTVAEIGGRKVSHVRFVGRASSGEAAIRLSIGL